MRGRSPWAVAGEQHAGRGGYACRTREWQGVISVFRGPWQRRAWLSMALLFSTGAMGTFAAAGAFAQVRPVGAMADVRDANGRSVATAEFREGRGEVLVTILFANPQTLTGTHG